MQGIGQALFEAHVVYGEDGQILTGSFTDYALPARARARRRFRMDYHSVPAKTNVHWAPGLRRGGAAQELATRR